MTAYEFASCLVGSELCLRDRISENGAKGNSLNKTDEKSQLPQGLRRLTPWLQLGKAWWDTPAGPALGRQKQEDHCEFKASPGLYGECQDT